MSLVAGLSPERNKSVKPIILAVLMAALVPAWGQTLDLKFDSIAAKAKEKAEVDLDAAGLGLLLKVSGVKGIEGVTGVIVRNYEFAKAGEYANSDLDPLRKQVAGAAGWSRIVNVSEDNETTEIYLFTTGDKPAGFLIISAEAKELTVVQIKGTIQLSQLAQLEELVQSKVAYDLKNVPAGTAAP